MGCNAAASGIYGRGGSAWLGGDHSSVDKQRAQGVQEAGPRTDARVIAELANSHHAVQGMPYMPRKTSPKPDPTSRHMQASCAPCLSSLWPAHTKGQDGRAVVCRQARCASSIDACTQLQGSNELFCQLPRFHSTTRPWSEIKIKGAAGYLTTSRIGTSHVPAYTDPCCIRRSTSALGKPSTRCSWATAGRARLLQQNRPASLTYAPARQHERAAGAGAPRPGAATEPRPCPTPRLSAPA
jgi:hypothetical protein